MSITITPSIGYNADGSEYISYDNGSVEDSNYTEFLGSRGIEQDVDSDYVWDHRTQSYRHRYADIDGEELEDRLEGTNDDLDDLQIQGYMELVGGQEAYNQMTAWAANSLSEEWIQDFDTIIDEGSPSDIEAAIETLYQLYAEGYEGNSDDYEETDPELQELHNLGYDSEYQDMISWAGEFLNEDQINAYDSLMESNDPEEVRNAIAWLLDLYQTHG
jgi:hypothetical protein